MHAVDGVECKGILADGFSTIQNNATGYISVEDDNEFCPTIEDTAAQLERTPIRKGGSTQICVTNQTGSPALTGAGIAKEVAPNPANAPPPMEVTVLGIVKLVRALQSPKDATKIFLL